MLRLTQYFLISVFCLEREPSQDQFCLGREQDQYKTNGRLKQHQANSTQLALQCLHNPTAKKIETSGQDESILQPSLLQPYGSAGIIAHSKNSAKLCLSFKENCQKEKEKRIEINIYIYIQYTYKRQSKQLTTTKNSEKQTKYVPNFYLMKESSKF